MMQRRRFKAYLILFPIALAGLSGCSTISKDECRAASVSGSWEEIGFKDGRKGKSSDRFAKIAKACHKHDVAADRLSYIHGYDRGVPLYCTYDNGFSRGEYGQAPKSQCVAINAVAYLDGQADGYIVYQIKSEHDSMIAAYEEVIEKLVNVRERLERDGVDGPKMDEKERRKLRRKELRLEDEREDIRIDIRAFERLHGLPRYDFD